MENLVELDIAIDAFRTMHTEAESDKTSQQLPLFC